MVDPTSVRCGETGCPFLDSADVASPEAATYPDLARANLLRMRAEYKEASDLCLSILKRFPGSFTAHTLLGDIAAEQNELQQAADWYEMALDLRPESEAERRKLENVSRRMREHDAAVTAEHLGLPTNKNKAAQFAVVLVALVLLTGAVAFLLGRRQSSTPTPIETRGIDVAAGRVEPPPTNVVDPKPNPETGSEVKPVERPAATVAEDASLLASVKALDQGARIVEATKDPRSGSATFSFEAAASDDLQLIAATLGMQALDKLPDIKGVTLRAIRGGKVEYMADVLPERVATLRQKTEGRVPTREETITVLSNEWPQAASPPAGSRG